MVAAHIALYGDEATYAIVLSNVQSGMVQRLATDLHSLLLGDGVVSTPPDVQPVDMSAAQLASFEGDYSSEHIPVPLRVRVENGQLTSRWGDNPFRMIWLPVGEDEFFTRQEYARAHLERDSSGVGTGATIAWPQGTPPLVRAPQELAALAKYLSRLFQGTFVPVHRNGGTGQVPTPPKPKHNRFSLNLRVSGLNHSTS